MATAVTGDMILRDLADIVEEGEGIECCEDGIVERSLEDKLSRLRSSEPLADDDPTPSAFSRLSSFFFAGVPICVDPSNSTGSSGITSMARKLTSYFAASRPVLADDPPTVITTPNNKPPRCENMRIGSRHFSFLRRALSHFFTSTARQIGDAAVMTTRSIHSYC